jgi:hypothetical protein
MAYSIWFAYYFSSLSNTTSCDGIVALNGLLVVPTGFPVYKFFSRYDPFTASSIFLDNVSVIIWAFQSKFAAFATVDLFKKAILNLITITLYPQFILINSNNFFIGHQAGSFLTHITQIVSGHQRRAHHTP